MIKFAVVIIGLLFFAIRLMSKIKDNDEIEEGINDEIEEELEEVKEEEQI